MLGLAGISPASAVTFVENHDTDLNSGDNVVFNKVLGYAYILTSEGYPCVYYRDYDMGPDGYKLKPKIDNLIWIHEKLATGRHNSGGRISTFSPTSGWAVRICWSG